VNRVLSLPYTKIIPGQLDALMRQRTRTTVRRDGTVRFDLPGGRVEMRLAAGQTPLPPGSEVYVWWKGGGFICAPVQEVDYEEQRARNVVRRVEQARAVLAAARADRWARLSAYGDLPETKAEDERPVSIY
jgi:hypothetical protein